ncbi:hypothetical protein [Chelativorans sp. YIM 93263]|uniref:hypothetical protein n=1 Tax=Chelativorans sp. YIM 93263 TaxID=2906648 RepID=UPI0030838073
MCEFGDRRRDVMGRNGTNGRAGWTELFFLDEVTALAAGHRPCFFCRREDARAFAEAFAQGQGASHFSAPEMDRQLHRERRASGGSAELLDSQPLAALPDGTMVERWGRGYALKGGRLLPWGFAGYETPQRPEQSGLGWSLITPLATVAALRQGYCTVWHPSANS